MSFVTPKDSPVILIGAQRSGTTWLGSVLSTHPDLAYFEEPRHIWCWGNANTPDDRLTAEHATPIVARHIRESFEKYTTRHNTNRLCEKTPSNCLRVPFIHKIYPNAKFLFVVRDGRSVIRSTAEIMAGGVPTSGILKRAVATPPWEWPAYSGKLLSTLKQKFFGGSLEFWGPRPPGWKRWLEDDHTDVVLAKQWASTVSTAYEDLHALGRPGDAFFMFHYEDMARDPRATMTRLTEYLEIDTPNILIEKADRTANPDTINSWRNDLCQETLDRIQPHMAPTLENLGYSW